MSVFDEIRANLYPHMCCDGHPEIGHSTDGERCPVCLERDRAEKAEAERDEAMTTMCHERGDKEQAEAELAALEAENERLNNRITKLRNRITELAEGKRQAEAALASVTRLRV